MIIEQSILSLNWLIWLFLEENSNEVLKKYIFRTLLFQARGVIFFEAQKYRPGPALWKFVTK